MANNLSHWDVGRIKFIKMMILSPQPGRVGGHFVFGADPVGVRFHFCALSSEPVKGF